MEKKRILVVDDDKSQLKSLTQILRLEDYEVDTAETGHEATDKLKTQLYDLALIDVRLPDMEGTELLKVIDNHVPRTAKIIITGYPSTENADKALNLKADAYIIKPVEPERLLKIIREKLEQQEETKAE